MTKGFSLHKTQKNANVLAALLGPKKGKKKKSIYIVKNNQATNLFGQRDHVRNFPSDLLLGSIIPLTPSYAI